MKFDLSILIPARNEAFLAQTVQNLTETIRGNTEIIVGLDGKWANPPVYDDPRITIVYYAESIGQRALTNQLCKLSQAKYVMKVDAHCAFAEGFDQIMVRDMKDDWTMAPMMYNLHAFDWVCHTCGNRVYQGPPIESCTRCGGKMGKEMLWQPRMSTGNWAYRFDKSLHFQYWGALKHRPGYQGQLPATLSLQGSCFMLTREKYWELNICDEEHGSWGQQGTEVACKTWLSGGEVHVNKNTWYAHLFRTRKDFGFPYPISGAQQEHARRYSRELFIDGKFDKAIHPLSWLLDKFYPVPEWHDENSPVKTTTGGYTGIKEAGPEKGIIYYTDNALTMKIATKVRKQLSRTGLPIVSASLKPMPDFGTNIHIPAKRGYLTMAKQILAALEASTANIIYFCEHDVLYHPSHFELNPGESDYYYYNTNVWRVRYADGHALYCDDLRQLSGLFGYREFLLEHFRTRMTLLEKASREMTDQEFNKYVRQMGFEPGTHNREQRVDSYSSLAMTSLHPNIDIRHEANLTPSRWSKDQFRNEIYTRGWKEQDTVAPWNWIPGKFDEFIRGI